MNPTSTSVAARSGAWLVIAAALLVSAGCGGGGGGGGGESNATSSGVPAAPPATPSPAPAPAPAPPPPVATSYLVAGSSSSETGDHSVVVADAEAQGAAVLRVPVQALPPMVSTTAYTPEAGARQVTLRGSPMTFFVNAGQLWQIDLTRGRAPASQRISSLADGCQPMMVAALDATGLDAWVVVSTAGADGSCSAEGDNRQVFVRTGTPIATAPTPVPAGIWVEPAYLSGDDGALWWILAVDSTAAVPRLVAYGPTLNVVDVVGGSGIRALFAQGHGASASEGTFVRADDTLRRIEASATGISIGGPQLTFSGASRRVIYDRPAVYLNDGDSIYRVEGQSQATLLARPNPGSVSALLMAQTPGQLVLAQVRGSGEGTVSAIDKRSGAVRALLSQDRRGSNEVWALRGETLFYFTGARLATGELRSINTDGSADVRVATNLVVVGRVLSRVWDKGQATEIDGTRSLLACQPLPGNVDCRGSTLIQIDLATRSITALGSFANSRASGWVAVGVSAFEGIKGAGVEVHISSASPGPVRKDFYVFNPGEANSLRQVTPTTP